MLFTFILSPIFIAYIIAAKGFEVNRINEKFIKYYKIGIFMQEGFRKKTSPVSGDAVLLIVITSGKKLNQNKCGLLLVLLGELFSQRNDVLTGVLAHIVAAALAHGF